jgi:hypothetical protein
MKGPSKHLSWQELACKDGNIYPSEWRNSRAIILAGVFELIRDYFGGKPITVLSGYRTYEHNLSIGGARNSQHLQGRALDLRPPAGVTVIDFCKGIKEISKNSQIGGIGLYKTFVHVDIRSRGPSDRIAKWSGAGVKDSLT